MSRLSCLYVVYGRYGAVIPARGGRSSGQEPTLSCLAAPPAPPHLTPGDVSGQISGPGWRFFAFEGAIRVFWPRSERICCQASAVAIKEGGKHDEKMGRGIDQRAANLLSLGGGFSHHHGGRSTLHRPPVLWDMFVHHLPALVS